MNDSVVSIAMSERIQKDLQEMIRKGGMHKTEARKASKVAAGVVDDHGRAMFKSFAYAWGSSKSALRGYTTKKGKTYSARERFRVWAGRKASIKFQTKKSRQTDFWHRSMVRYQNGGKGNPSTLSHLIEFGSFHYRTRRFNRADNIKRAAFRDRQRMALGVLEKGLALAVQNATAGTKMGLVKFRKSVT